MPLPDAEFFVSGIEEGNKSILARAITLIESNAPAHRQLAQLVLQQLLPRTGHSIRIGITGVPGVGKSTFIEAFGTHLCDLGKKVAVLAVDPSSTISRGSILGDKTRMEKLSRNPSAFIRPSPSGGTLGGLNRKSRETLLLCEAFGFDVVLVETVGVGQSETTVRSMVDFFLLLLLAGAGDELQGIKKGIVELADGIAVNKADGDNKIRAEASRLEYQHAVHYLHPATRGWTTQVRCCSAYAGDGIADLWKMTRDFSAATTVCGSWQQRRQQQVLAWLHSQVEDLVVQRFYHSAAVKEILPGLEQKVLNSEIPVTQAVEQLLGLV